MGDVVVQVSQFRPVRFALRAKTIDRHDLTVTAHGSGVSDAVKRSVEVVPDGRRKDFAWNGSLSSPADVVLPVDDAAIDGSARAFVKVYRDEFQHHIDHKTCTVKPGGYSHPGPRHPVDNTVAHQLAAD